MRVALKGIEASASFSSTKLRSPAVKWMAFVLSHTPTLAVGPTSGTADCTVKLPNWELKINLFSKQMASGICYSDRQLTAWVPSRKYVLFPRGQKLFLTPKQGDHREWLLTYDSGVGH